VPGYSVDYFNTKSERNISVVIQLLSYWLGSAIVILGSEKRTIEQKRLRNTDVECYRP